MKSVNYFLTVSAIGKPLPNQTKLKNSSKRDPRILGKISILAGLKLPDISASDRGDTNTYNQKGSSPYWTTYNFPPAKWGPYIAAVYEPPSFYSFIQNPLEYLAAIFNPFNWFTSSGSSIDSDVTVMTEDTTNKDQDNDIVLVVNNVDDEMRNGDRIIQKQVLI